MAVKAWIGGAGDWSTAAGWSPPGVPGMSDSVSLGAGANVTIAEGEAEAVGAVSLTDPTAGLIVDGTLQDATVQLSGGQLQASGGFGNVTLTSTVTTSTLTVADSLVVGSAAPGQPGLIVRAPGVTVIGTGHGALDIGPLLSNDGAIALLGSSDPARPVTVQNLIVSGQMDVVGAVVLKSATAQALIDVAPGGDLVLQGADMSNVRIVSGTVDDSMGNSLPEVAAVDVTFDDAAGKLVTSDSGRPTVTGFRAGDTIDVKGVSVSGPLSPNGSGALQVGGAVITLQGLTASGATYAAASDGSGGTLVTTTSEPAATVAFSDATTGAKGSHALAVASGGPSYLQWQYVEAPSGQYGDTDTVAMTATVPNVFLKGGIESKALAVTSGQNVLDGGTGSAFLSGGSGTDTFFVDIRGANLIWDTLANFHAGDAVTIWGWVPGVGTETVDAQAGAAGYQGATLRLANSEGEPVSSVTFAGFSADQVAHLRASTGAVNNVPYLYLYNPGV